MKIIFSGDVFLGGDLNHKAVENLINVTSFHMEIRYNQL